MYTQVTDMIWPHLHLIVVHGYRVDPHSNWFPALADLLDAAEVSYSIPALPGDKQPQAEEWVEAIATEVAAATKPVVLIGHSLGTRAILLYLDKYRPQLEAVVLVGPLSNSLANAQRRGGAAYPDFFNRELDLQQLKPLARKWLILHSVDDPALEYHQHGVALSQELGVPLLTFQDQGHFYEPAAAEVVFQAVQELLTDTV